MKLATSLTPPPSAPSLFRGALIFTFIIATLWNTHSAAAAPAQIDSLDSTFPLDLQPPIFEATASETSSSQPNGDNKNNKNNDGTTIDSYGNPIESLQPIETPDGRKVVSAQGLQFEIPNYASGITELKKPSDDLLPPFVDKIGSEEQNKKQRNPFLPSSFDDGKYKPQANSGRRTTTTTTTPAPAIVEPNPFEPTIPPWLRDFDYPDLAAGVPFVYDPNEDESPVDKNILPPSKTEETNKPTFITNTHSSSSPFLNSQTPQGFTNKFTSSATSLTSSSSIPSIVTIPLPSTQTNQDDSTFSRPPLVFVPPPTASAEGNVDVAKKTSSTFNKHFAAPFDSTPATAATTTTTATLTSSKKSPLSADRESFPPFNNAITGSSTLPSKTTFTKSEDGKVITNNIFLSGSIGSTSAKPFGTSQTEKNTLTTQSFSGSAFTKSTTASSVFKQFGTTSSAASGFVTSGDSTSTFGSTSSSDASKYTGRFGGPPGVLAPQSTGFTTSTTTVTKSYNQPSFTTFGVTTSPGFAATKKDKFTGSFGGPPGVLKPYDNVKNRK